MEVPVVKQLSRRPVILYRKSLMDAEELAAAKERFACVFQRTALRRDDLVIPRYCVLPEPVELQDDVDLVGANLLNDLRQHRYLADMRNWVEDLREFTPKTWYRLEDVDEDGPYVLKGQTNSRKGDWNTHCFAKDRAAMEQVYWRLCTDGLIGLGQQQIYIRKYVPLAKLIDGLNGIPVTREFRFFTAFGKILCGAYYWQNYLEDLPAVPDVSEVPIAFVQSVLDRVKDHANGIVIDVAQTATGDWICIELNDLCMSGLSCNDPKILYTRLKEVLFEQEFGS